MVHVILKTLNFPFVYSDKSIEKVAMREESRLFFLAIINRMFLRGDPPKRLNFGGTSPRDRGVTAFDLEVLTQKNLTDVKHCLPATTVQGVDLINYHLGLMSGSKGSKYFNSLPSLIRKAMSKKIAIEANVWDEVLEGTKIAIGEVVKDVPRTKEVKEKNRVVRKPIHISRPSQHIMAVFDVEKSHLKTLEKPWDDISELSDEYKEGVPISEVIEVREKYKSAYNSQFEVASKLSTWRSRHEEAFKDIFFKIMKNDIKKKSMNLTEKLKIDLLAAFDEYNLDTDHDIEVVSKIMTNLNPCHLDNMKFKHYKELNYYNIETIFTFDPNKIRKRDIALIAIWSDVLEYASEVIPNTINRYSTPATIAKSNVERHLKQLQYNQGYIPVDEED